MKVNNLYGILFPLRHTSLGLVGRRLPFFSSSERRGDGGGVAFWPKSFFCGDSSRTVPRPDSAPPSPQASVRGMNPAASGAYGEEGGNEVGKREKEGYNMQGSRAGRPKKGHFV